jgi:hypothetical protein
MSVIMSIFNKEDLCKDCRDAEKKHPKYEEARKAEADAVRAGHYHFPGIGKPRDL